MTKNSCEKFDGVGPGTVAQQCGEGFGVNTLCTHNDVAGVQAVIQRCDEGKPTDHRCAVANVAKRTVGHGNVVAGVADNK